MAEQSDELFPRHLKVLAACVSMAQHSLTADEKKKVREAMKIIRELGRQHRLRRWVNGPNFPRD